MTASFAGQRRRGPKPSLGERLRDAHDQDAAVLEVSGDDSGGERQDVLVDELVNGRVSARRALPGGHGALLRQRGVGRPAGTSTGWSAFVALARSRLARHADASAGDDGCWPWRGSVNLDGYGRVMIDCRSHLAHRLTLSLKLGRPLRSHEVTRHLCIGNRLCVNPAHLDVGTVADNNHDLSIQDRVAHGERSPAAKLTADQVGEIRRRAAGMGYGKYELLGREFGVSGRQIAYICSAERWRRSAGGPR